MKDQAKKKDDLLKSNRELKDALEKLQRAQSELRSAQMQLIQAEKLESLGRLAAGVAHEVKNPLASIKMGVDYLKKRLQVEDDTSLIVIEMMDESVLQAENIIRGMVDYSRSDSLKLSATKFDEVVRRSVRMLAHESLQKSIDIQVRSAESLPDVKVDAGKMEQVIINLLMNGIQASETGGTIFVDLELGFRVGNTEIVERIDAVSKAQKIEPGVIVRISDVGCGMSDEHIRRAFEPFFTTKPTGEGTGLGLSVAKNIVDLHRGKIWLESNGISGVTALVWIPCVSGNEYLLTR